MQRLPLVLVHGMNSSKETFRDALDSGAARQHLGDGAEVLCVDLHGHGDKLEAFLAEARADLSAHGGDLDDALERKAAARRLQGMHRHVASLEEDLSPLVGEFPRGDEKEDVEPWWRCQIVLVGHSMGARVAAAFAAKHPGLVRHLVLVDMDAEPRGPFSWLKPALGDDEARREHLSGAALKQRARVAVTYASFGELQESLGEHGYDAAWVEKFRRTGRVVEEAPGIFRTKIHPLVASLSHLALLEDGCESEFAEAGAMLQGRTWLFVAGVRSAVSASGLARCFEVMPRSNCVHFPEADHSVHNHDGSRQLFFAVIGQLIGSSEGPSSSAAASSLRATPAIREAAARGKAVERAYEKKQDSSRKARIMGAADDYEEEREEEREEEHSEKLSCGLHEAFEDEILFPNRRDSELALQSLLAHGSWLSSPSEEFFKDDNSAVSIDTSSDAGRIVKAAVASDGGLADLNRLCEKLFLDGEGERAGELLVEVAQRVMGNSGASREDDSDESVGWLRMLRVLVMVCCYAHADIFLQCLPILMELMTHWGEVSNQLLTTMRGASSGESLTATSPLIFMEALFKRVALGGKVKSPWLDFGPKMLEVFFQDPAFRGDTDDAPNKDEVNALLSFAAVVGVAAAEQGPILGFSTSIDSLEFLQKVESMLLPLFSDDAGFERTARFGALTNQHERVRHLAPPLTKSARKT